MGDELVSHIQIIINGTQEFSGDVEEWEAKRPDTFRDALKPGAQPKPWMKAVMIAFTDAILSKQSVIIDCTHRSNRWSLMVEAQK